MRLAFFQRRLESLTHNETESLLAAIIEGRDAQAAAVQQGKMHDLERGMTPIQIATVYAANDREIALFNDLIVRLTADLSVQPAVMVG
jgi:hypothetical protein